MDGETASITIGSYPRDVDICKFIQLRNYIAESSDFVESCDSYELDKLYLDDFVNNPNRTNFFAIDSNTGLPVGFCFVSKNTTDGDSAYITNLAVSPDYRKQGVASRLIKCAEEYTLHEGLKISRLYVETTNLQAAKLYEDSGYRLKGTISYLEMEKIHE